MPGTSKTRTKRKSPKSVSRTAKLSLKTSMTLESENAHWKSLATACAIQSQLLLVLMEQLKERVPRRVRFLPLAIRTGSAMSAITHFIENLERQASDPTTFAKSSSVGLSSSEPAPSSWPKLQVGPA